MVNEKQTSLEETSTTADVYFGLMAEMDFTKHLGGMEATSELIELCHIESSSYVLDVGCGVGVTPCYLAKRYGRRVVGVDLYEKMIDRSSERARREGLTAQVEFRTADAQALPFEDGLFDVVIGESILAFVKDREGAISEWVRVAKPGGYVGFTEATWIKTPTPEFLAYMSRAFGPVLEILPPDGWKQLLAGAGLRDIGARTHDITVRSEARNRIRRVGVKHLVKLWCRALFLAVTRPAFRNLMKEALSEPKELMEYWGYGVWVGRK